MVATKEKWKKASLASISTINGKYGANAAACALQEGKPRYIRITDIDENGCLLPDNIVGAKIENYNEYLVEKNDLLFVRTGSTTGKTYLHLDEFGDYIYAGFLIKFKIDLTKADPYYVWNLTKTNSYTKWTNMMSVRSGQPGINSQDFGKFEFLLPPLPEQKKIAEILSTWDEAINSNERLLQFVKQQKSVYVNKIFMGRHFANIDDKKAFEKLSRHIVEKTDRNKSDNTSDVLSVSNTKGFVLQSDQFEREIASKDKNNYKIIRKGQFAYNPSRVNVGSIDQLTERDIGIISPMYVVFECKDTINSRYLYHFLKSEYFLRLIPRFTQGSVRDSLSFDGLSNMKIHIPSIYKQVKYSSLLDTFDEKIKVLERKNDYLKMQKQGLMQRLLTGKIRVKLD